MSIDLNSITWPSVPNVDSVNSMPSSATGPSATGPSATGPSVTGPVNIVGLDGLNIGGGIPLTLIIITVIIIAYYILFSTLGSDTSISNETTQGNKGIELLLWGIFIFLLLVNGMSYIFSIDVIASIKNIFSPVTKIDIKVKEDKLNTILPGSHRKQVFHIPDNKYNYEDSKAICSAFDGRLATYNEINSAYNEGADWCGYGWSDEQMALFPTQEEKWKNLQKIEGHHHDCGRPGINGGFIDNPKIKFGINCFGIKPDITSAEAQSMSNTELYPKTKREILFDKKVDYWRQKMPNIMISPFNSDNWSII
jgi:hypothetical protein